jgi:hypothetical protein
MVSDPVDTTSETAGGVIGRGHLLGEAVPAALGLTVVVLEVADAVLQVGDDLTKPNGLGVDETLQVEVGGGVGGAGVGKLTLSLVSLPAGPVVAGCVLAAADLDGSVQSVGLRWPMSVSW